MADVFISYKKEDRALASDVVAAVCAAGYSVWWDEDLTPRSSWDTEIEQEIARASAVLVLWTAKSVGENTFVRNEADYAKQHSKLVPIRLEQCDLPLAFRRIQTADLASWDRRDLFHPEWLRTLGWLANLVNGSPARATDVASTPTASSVRRVGAWVDQSSIARLTRSPILVILAVLAVSLLAQSSANLISPAYHDPRAEPHPQSAGYWMFRLADGSMLRYPVATNSFNLALAEARRTIARNRGESDGAADRALLDAQGLTLIEAFDTCTKAGAFLEYSGLNHLGSLIGDPCRFAHNSVSLSPDEVRALEAPKLNFRVAASTFLGGAIHLLISALAGLLAALGGKKVFRFGYVQEVMLALSIVVLLEAILAVGQVSTTISEPIRQAAADFPDQFLASQDGSKALQLVGGNYTEAVEIVVRHARGWRPLLAGAVSLVLSCLALITLSVVMVSGFKLNKAGATKSMS